MGQAIRLTDANFGHEVLMADMPVLVDFWASWCPPCKMTEPIIDELTVEYSGRLKVGKLNVDQNPESANRYQVMGVPTFAVFVAGAIVEERVGAQSRAQLKRIIDKVLAAEQAKGEVT